MEASIERFSNASSHLALVVIGLVAVFQSSFAYVRASSNELVPPLRAVGQVTPPAPVVDVLTVGAIVSPIATILLGIAVARYNHIGKMARLDLERIEKQRILDANERMLGVEAQIKMLERGLRCGLPECPVTAIATGARPFDSVQAYSRESDSVATTDVPGTEPV